MGGLSVSPLAGRLIVFFSRGPDGAVDPLSFHGGADVLPMSVNESLVACRSGQNISVDGALGGKWTLQLFREVPFELPEHLLSSANQSLNEDQSSNYVSRSRKLQKARARIMAAASGSGPLNRVVEDVACSGAQRARAAALTKLGLVEDDLRRLSCMRQPSQ